MQDLYTSYLNFLDAVLIKWAGSPAVMTKAIDRSPYTAWPQLGQVT